MIDPRFERLAKLLIEHSTSIQPGEHLLIEAFDVPDAAVATLIKACRSAGGHPHVALRKTRLIRELVQDATEEQIRTWAFGDIERMKKMQAYIGLRGSQNVSEMAGLPEETMKMYGKYYMNPVHIDQRVNHTKWCALRWPTASMAQLAQMNTERFEQFYFDVCTLDYEKMARAVAPLAERMRQADRVHIEGPGETDLTFSIKNIPVIPCTGSHNIPDGECFTAPVKESVNGVMQYNTPTIYEGESFENIRLEFKEGRIVRASCEGGDNDILNSIFDTDAGARYVGEFAIGFNPFIMKPMKDILFDEKIAGSLHFTPGQAYEDADNGNRSDIHWDLVLIQRGDYGGGTISFDGEVIRRDGVFIVDDLAALNPESLKG